VHPDQTEHSAATDSAAEVIPPLTIAVAAGALALFVLPGTANVLQFDRAALTRGEVWRVFSGHLTHFDASHLTWDVVTLLGLGAVSERTCRVQTAVALLAAAIAISVALWLCQPQFDTYRGLSGLDCALGGLIAGNLLRRSAFAARCCGAVITAFVAGKCGHELIAATPIFARAGAYAPVPLAHLIGFVVGLGTASLIRPISRCRKRG
jgi:rhomboid family GlyGly-CTERM serine protease